MDFLVNIDTFWTAENLVGFSYATIIEGTNLVHSSFAIVTLEKEFFGSGIVLGKFQSRFLDLATIV